MAGLLDSLGDWGLPIATVLGAVAGGSSGGNSATTKSNELDPRMAALIYGTDGKGGLLADAQSIYKQQMAQGGMNDMQRQGLDMKRQYLQSPQYTNSYQTMMNQGMNLMNSPIAGNPFTRQQAQRPGQNMGGGGFQYAPMQQSQAPIYRPQAPAAQAPQTSAPTERQPTVQPGQGGQGGRNTFGNIGNANTSGSGSGGSAPGGQGNSNDATSAALGMMAIGANPFFRFLSPAPAAITRALGGAMADKQIDARSAAAAKLEASQPMMNLGIGTVSDESGNVRTYSTPESIAAADALAFGIGPSWDDQAATIAALKAEQEGRSGSGGGGYGRFGTFGRNNMAGDASGTGFGGQSGFGGYGVA